MYLILVFSKMRLLLNVSLLILCAGCNSLKSMGPQDYLDWYSSKEFAWKGTDTLADISCSIRLFPMELSIARCAVQECEPKEVLKERLSGKDETIEFMIEFSGIKPNTSVFDVPGTKYSKTDKILYLSNGIKDDIKGITSTGDTIICQHVLYEPSIPKKARLLITLEETKKNISRLIIKDRQITGETISFRIPELNHKSIPTLKL